MEHNKNIRRSVTIGVIIGISLAPFQFWPFTLVFMILGGIATGIITALTGYMINYFLVLLVEYALMLIIMSIAIYIVKNGVSMAE